MYEIHYHVVGTTWTQTGTTLYYPAGGAMQVTTESPHTETLYYILSDHLGSTSVTTSASGVIAGDIST